MPGYGILEPDEGTGLLPWSWARERLERSRDYWIATRWPDGRPHLMPVWGIWRDRSLVFSSARASRKARNLVAEPRCTVATDDPLEPVVVEGVATFLEDSAEIATFASAVNAKHDVEYPVSFYAAPENVCIRIDAVSAIGLVEADFTGSPTRWDLR
jgi:nitroimidazol reductase NimA-like FMN-containing flavoprotein (pyridoxamine 5'-phosphate oxidase superfamily)